MTKMRHRALFHVGAIVLVQLLWPASSNAQAELYGVHEITVIQSPIWSNPFKDVTLHATFVHSATSATTNFWGYYDGDGLGNQVAGSVWRIRFMPDRVGNWTVSWWFSNGATTCTPSAKCTGSFTVSDTGIPGPPKLDPNNSKLLVDARGNPIHWRGYGIKHLGKEYGNNFMWNGTEWVPDFGKPPFSLSLANATKFANDIIDGRLWARGYNAALIQVPNGWTEEHWYLNGLKNALWGDYVQYDLRAGAYFDIVMKRLHQRRIWAIGWITFGIQDTAGLLAANYPPFVRYFIARYGAFYNYFMWSPMWEVHELGTGWENNVDILMSYVVSQDPWKRLQGVHDRAKSQWMAWQSIQPRQAADASAPMRDIFRGNNRTIGVDATLSPYAKVIIGSEDIWEFCSGSHGKPRNGTEVRRGLFGELFANVLPLYDENMDGDPPCGGLGNGGGHVYVKWALDWWYANVLYRHPSFIQLNGPACGAAQICSGVVGTQYVFYKQGAGTITVNLSYETPGSLWDVMVYNAETRTFIYSTVITGGSPPMSANLPYDTLALANRRP